LPDDMKGQDLSLFGFAFALDETLLSGVTGACPTFNSPCLVDVLAESKSFRVLNVEAWSLTPCTLESEAASLEMGKLFVETSPKLDLLGIFFSGADRPV